MRFFTDCKDQDEAKSIYRKWAKILHPDKGGDPDLMAKLKGQYDDYKSGKVIQPEFKQAFTGNRTAFDHPIHEEMRALKGVIAELEKEKMDLQQRNIFLDTQKRNLEENMFRLECTLEEDRSTVISLQHANSTLYSDNQRLLKEIEAVKEEKSSPLFCVALAVLGSLAVHLVFKMLS